MPFSLDPINTASNHCYAFETDLLAPVRYLVRVKTTFVNDGKTTAVKRNELFEDSWILPSFFSFKQQL